MHLTQAHHLTWAEVYYIQPSTLTPYVHAHSLQWLNHANLLHAQSSLTHPAARATTIPTAEPDWTYQPQDTGSSDSST